MSMLIDADVCGASRPSGVQHASRISKMRSELLTISRVFALILMLGALQGCERILPPTELKEIAKFDSSLPPDPGSYAKRFIERLNLSAIENAKAAGKPIALLIVDRLSHTASETPLWPTAPDLVLRAFVSRESLAASSVTGVMRNERSAIPENVLDSIDFSKQFAVVLARPKEVQNLPSTAEIYRNDSTAMYIDTLLRERTFGDTIILRLRSKIIGQSPMLPREWSSKVFVIDRENAAYLKFRVGEEEYVYSFSGDSPSSR